VTGGGDRKYRYASFRARLGYYARVIRRRGVLGRYAVLALSVYIVLAILMPPLARPLRSVGVDLPEGRRYAVTGSVTDTASRAASGISVYVGGYRTTTDSEGIYRLRFKADAKLNVPIIFASGQNEVVRRFDIGSGDAIVNAVLP
jgi:hypothetical protein